VVTYPVVEHQSTRAGRWLRARRLRIAFVIAVVETLLILPPIDALGWFPVLAIALVVFALYFFVGRKSRHDTVRELSWTAAVSQLLPVFIPIIVVVVGTLVIVALFAVLIVIGVILFLDRR
jgi:asparagine N-glycosylation enzyme membrane subunit Stt3